MASRACIDFVLETFQVAAASVIWLQCPVTKPALSQRPNCSCVCVFLERTQSIQASASGCSPGPRAQNLLWVFPNRCLLSSIRKSQQRLTFGIRKQILVLPATCTEATQSTQKTFITRQVMGNSREDNLSEIPAHSCQYLNQVNFSRPGHPLLSMQRQYWLDGG